METSAKEVGFPVETYVVEFRALGPLTVDVDGRSLKLGGPRQRMVLAVLLSRANHTVSQDALIEAVWAGEPPEAAKSTLQSYISGLRRELGADAILRQGDGYRVNADTDSFDVLAFEDSVQRGRQLMADDPEAARSVLAAGLGKWFGSPYGGLDDNPVLAGEVTRLDELRLVAVESRIDADLESGNHTAVVGELETLVREHPLRERFRAQQMLALYRSGRQAEALRAYQQVRTFLADELGIDPSAELRNLEQRILDQDPGLRVESKSVTERKVFLFTDVEGSTLLWEVNPQLAQVAIDLQDQIICRTVSEYGGSVFKKTGDGLYAHFGLDSAAVQAALAAQNEMNATDWGETGPIKVRMAIVAGEVELRGGEFSGQVLHRAARILGMGHGGQTLVSEDVAEELRDLAESRLLGEYRLRGMGVPEKIYQLITPGIPDEFPPLRTDRPTPPLLGDGGGRTVRGYELREPLGRGDFGVVYRAFQPSVGREVAVKVIRPEYANNLAFVRRFEREAQIVAQLEHPHILPLYDFWRDPEGAFLVMPIMRGGSLAAVLRRGGWNLAPALQLLDQIGGALAYAHRRGVIHRDIKPGNVLLDEEGYAYLSDFGIASRLTDDAEIPLTSSMAFVPPEELRGEQHTSRSDVFSIGVLTFQLMTGVVPPGYLPLPPLDEVRPGLPARLAEVVARATAADPRDRFERVDDFLRAVRQAVGADVVAVADVGKTSPALEPARNPYKGLRAFGETDAIDFHGRAALADELLQAVASHNLVAVVGPSGSGKSSVVRAGLIPTLRAGGIPGSRHWLLTDMFPGSYPFEELEAALLRVAVDRPAGLLTDLLEPNGLLRVSKQILPGDDSTLLIVIDQFEELFSSVRSEATRRLFLENLTAVAADERSRVRIVLTMRADFFNRPLEYGEFAEILGEGMVTVGPPTRDGLAQAIAAPARAVGIDLEAGLVGRIIADVENQPGGLPLLQYALTEMFSRRQGETLTIAGYEETGGVLGALGRRAEELFSELSESGQEAARQLFLRLVTVDESSADTRRRARQTELKSLDVDQDHLDAALRSYGAFRLLSFDRDPVTRGPTVEVAHEALLREWDRLRGWIEDERESLILARRLSGSTQEWIEADRDPSFLLRGTRLQQAQEWRETAHVALTGDEVAYLGASVEQQTVEEAAARRRRRRLVAGLSVGLVVLALLAVTAFFQRGVAEREARDARVRQLAGESSLALERDPELAMLIALEAVDLSRREGAPPLPEAIGALQSANQSSRLVMRIEGGNLPPRGAHMLGVAPDGSWLVTNGPASADLIVIQLPDGNRTNLTALDQDRITLPAPDQDLHASDVAVSSDGRLVAVSYVMPNLLEPAFPAHPDVMIFDPLTGDVLNRLAVPDGAWGLDFSPDNQHLAITSVTSVSVWEVGAGSEGTRLGAQYEIQAEFSETGFLADGDTVIIPVVDLGLVFYSVSREQEVHRILIEGGAYAMALSSDRTKVALLVGDRLQIHDLASSQIIQDVPNTDFQVVAWSPDGSHLAFAGFDPNISVVEVATGTTVQRLTGSRDNVFGLTFLDQRRLANTAADEVLVWDVSAQGPPELEAIRPHSGLPDGNFAVSPDQTKFAVWTWPGQSFELIHAATGDLLASLEDQLSAVGLGIRTISPDFSMVGALDHSDSLHPSDSRSSVRLLPSLEVVREFENCRSPLAFNPDSTLVVVTGYLCVEDPLPGAPEVSQLVELESGRVVLEIPHRFILWAEFNLPGDHEGGRYLALTSEGEVELYDLEAGSLIGELTEEAVPGGFLWLAFDPHGRYLAGGTLGGRVWAIDMATVVGGEEMAAALIFNREVHTGMALRPSITTDGLLATAGADGLVRIWDLKSDRLIVEFRSEIDPPVVLFAPDGSYLLYPDQGNIARFHLDLDRLVTLAESRLTRDFTLDECRLYREPENCTTSEGT